MFILHYVFLFLFMQATLQAVAYEHHVDEILNQGHTLKLDDGSYWEIKEEFEEVQKWQAGDRIALECRFTLSNNRECYFKNLHLETSTPISHLLDAQLLETSLYTVEAGKKNSYVRLNDLSIWSCCFFSCPFTYCDLNVQDRVIIFKASETEGYYLIKWDSSNPPLNEIQYATLNVKQEAPYRHFISKILFDENSDKYQIELENGLVWNRESTLFNTPLNISDWQVGDEVCLNYDADKNPGKDDFPYIKFYMINLRNLFQMKVDYSEEKAATYATIDSLMIYKSYYGFFDYAIMTLTDGSSWEVIDSSIRRWKKGDRVFISLDIDHASMENSFILINPTCGFTLSGWLFPSNSDNYIHSAIHAQKL